MTIVSHQHRLIFLKSRKTAGTAIERALVRVLGPSDWVATSTENEPVDALWGVTPNRTLRGPWGERAIKRLLRRIGPRALSLREHMPVDAVRRLVGEPVWSSYHKVSIVRDPWRRLVSLWRWRAQRDGIHVDFDRFLRAIESGSRSEQKAVGARRWSNLPFYAIGDERVVDTVLRFEHIADDFAALVRDRNLPDPGPLERVKVLNRKGSDLAARLEPGQVERISRLCATEIEWFGYRDPDIHQVRSEKTE